MLVLVAAAPSLALLVYFYLRDRYDREPVGCLLVAYLLGMYAMLAAQSMGAVLADAGRFNEAIEHFKKAIEILPQYQKAYSNLGKVLLDHGLSKEAEWNLRAALHLDRRDAIAQWYYGRYLEGEARFVEAADH